MVSGLRAQGVIVSERMALAMSSVPRHEFLPGLSLEAAYADRAVVVKRDGDGTPLSSASQPTMVATMLEQLAVASGQRVLEVGTGTGYNAALLAQLTGPAGTVVSIELDGDLAATAEVRLRACGLTNVTVRTGDGTRGFADGGPYARMIVTAAAPAVSPAWTEQLAAGGRLVVPLAHEHGGARSVAYDLIDGQLRARSEIACSFLPLRG
jgi:protein-L-isoaspartate(D-aspartate) O-methyltransferase